MNEFVASNGVTITVTRQLEDNKVYLLGKGGIIEGGERRWTEATASGNGMVALREFFQHERDVELGRWRDQNTPGYVAYDRGEGYVRIVREADGTSEVYVWEDVQAPGGLKPDVVARAFFDAHPELKPWHDAVDGELWLLRFSDFPDTDVSALVKNGSFTYNDHCHNGDAPLDEPTITAARRVWPEGDTP